MEVVIANKLAVGKEQLADNKRQNAVAGGSEGGQPYYIAEPYSRDEHLGN